MSPAADFEELKEGAALALYRKGEVFYNPAQVVNRDLSVLVLRHFQRSRASDGANPPPIRILEALSATGLRSIRYLKEVQSVEHVLANDLDPTAVETIRRNVAHNGADAVAAIEPHHGDAIDVMSQSRTKEKQYHVVDLDPYGSAAPFLDSAVQCVTDGGVLAVTCTDLAVLCGNSPEICYGRYASTPLKGPTAHEMAVRTVFASIQTAANRHGRAVEPIVCVKIDFYVRLFVRVRDSKHLAQQTPSSLSMVFQCGDCNTQRFQPLGRIRANPVSNTARKKRRRKEALAEQNGKVDSEKAKEGNIEKVGVETENKDPVDVGSTSQQNGEGVKGQSDKSKKPPQNVKYSPPLVVEQCSSTCTICGGAMLLGGPIWNGPLIGEGVAESLMTEISSGAGEFKARDRVSAIVRLLEEEVRTVPMFLHLPTMCKALRICPPPAPSVRSVLAKRGYTVSQSHTDAQAIKTDAPPELVWDILRLWVEKTGTVKKAKPRKEGENQLRPSVGERILAQKPSLIKTEEIDFTIKKDKFVRRGNMDTQAARYPQNPEPYWGPKARAGKRKRDESEETEQIKE